MENTYTVSAYSNADEAKWDNFVREAANATFLFERGFMDYHRDRFRDHSLIVTDLAGKWLAVMPAHVDGDVLKSHSGLTYGGLVYQQRTKLATVIKMLRAILFYLFQNGMTSLSIKMLPSIYAKFHSEGLLYALFNAGANLVRRDALSVLDLSKPATLSKDRRKCAQRGQTAGLEIREDNGLEKFWSEILVPNMKKKHDVSPVHSLAEIVALMKRFPRNIRHFNVYHNDSIVAGTTVFVTDAVAHPQYISANDEKNRLGSLDFLYSRLILDTFSEKRYFDFGISNEQNGRKLNENLIFWKESFGTGVVVQDFYEVPTANYKLLDSVLI